MSMSASDWLAIAWFWVFGCLSMRIWQALRSLLASMLDCRLMGFVAHAASAAAYVEYVALLLLVDS